MTRIVKDTGSRLVAAAESTALLVLSKTKKWSALSTRDLRLIMHDVLRGPGNLALVRVNAPYSPCYLAKKGDLTGT